MSRVPTLLIQARIASARALLELCEDDSSKQTAHRLLKQLETQLFTAVSMDILNIMIEQFPEKVTNALLLALAPPHLRSITLRCCRSLTARGVEGLLQKCPRLEQLDLAKVDQLMRPTFFQLCGCDAPQLTSINLEDNINVTDACVHAILLNLPNLKHLGLAGCVYLTDGVFLLGLETEMGRQVHRRRMGLDEPNYHCKLSSVDLQGCNNVSSTAIRYLTMLCGPSLTRLNLSLTGVDCIALWYLSGFSLASAVHLAMRVGVHLPESLYEEGSPVQDAEEARSVNQPFGSWEHMGPTTACSSEGEELLTSSGQCAHFMKEEDSPSVEASAENQPVHSKLELTDHADNNSARGSIVSTAEGKCNTPSGMQEADLKGSQQAAAACYVENFGQPSVMPENVAPLMPMEDLEDVDSDAPHVEDLLCIPGGNPFASPTKEDESAGSHALSPVTLPQSVAATASSQPQFVSASQLASADGASSSRSSSSRVEIMDPTVGVQQLYTPQLQSLEVTCVNSHVELSDACLRAFFITNPRLTELTMSWQPLTDELLIFIADHALELQALTITDCDLLTVGLGYLTSKCTKLRKLCILEGSFVGDAAIYPAIQHLECLKISEINITDILLKRIGAVAGSNLRELDLSWCEDITDDGIAAITSSCHQLRSLSLRQCKASNHTLMQMATTCCHLRDLNLYSVPDMNDTVLIHLALNLNHLTTIDVSWNSDITDASVCILLQHCGQLKDAHLAGIKQLTIKPFIHIISDVKRWQRSQALLRLKLNERQVLKKMGEEQYSSDEEYEELYLAHRSLTYAPHLATLDLEYCDCVNDGLLAEIVAVCRGTLAVRDYYGMEVRPSFVMCRKGRAFLAPAHLPADAV